MNNDKLRLEKILDSDDLIKVSDTLLFIAHNINDIEWAEKEFMKKADHYDEDICGLAITCLGHLARIQGKIDKKIVIPFLKEMMKSDNPIIASRAEDALDDINMFT
ncbi:hypothetical protein [Pantoea ananatis]|uniref:hypothetical protein n=1 Tax=Pantoea ananas TaxID=553 RepID=UPI0007DABCAB|nr:hypothetical protein [Pantoea ananatis]AWQ19650.1 hypothetical protein C1N63_12880 [Pantoea ananatis]MBN6033101.1 hypothetical protein [Pantoea ananatis]MCW0309826.1 hypothetical protein [Pantoea ananatis]MCW0311521.1 hypothetical protein [Pantoea ananatis]MCW0318993.1 hypothetical protein [Pantoea ananatis]